MKREEVVDTDNISFFTESYKKVEAYSIVPHYVDVQSETESEIQKEKATIVLSIPFSAFWLRSSVVSVLISLISDMWDIVSHDIKFIF